MSTPRNHRLDRVVIYTDGGSRGNPGPGAGAYIISEPSGRVICGKGVFLGYITNNAAEYTAVLWGLKGAATLGAKKVDIVSDSELVVKQLNGQYKVRNKGLLDLYEQAKKALGEFNGWTARHVGRQQNQQADRLANDAMDAGKDVPYQDSAAKETGRLIRLGVLVSGGGRTLANLKKEIDAGRLNAEIAVVICSRTRIKGAELSRSLGFEPVFVRKRDFADTESFSGRLAEVLDQAKTDLVVQAGWLCLWQIPWRYTNRVMNIHPALLPAFGGQGMWGNYVHNAVLNAGCKISGCTVHFCTNQYDAGPIIIQRSCPVYDNDCASSLAERVFEQECIAYPQAIALYGQDRLDVRNSRVYVQ